MTFSGSASLSVGFVPRGPLPRPLPESDALPKGVIYMRTNIRHLWLLVVMRHVKAMEGAK